MINALIFLCEKGANLDNFLKKKDFTIIYRFSLNKIFIQMNTIRKHCCLSLLYTLAR